MGDMDFLRTFKSLCLREHDDKRQDGAPAVMFVGS